LEPLGREEEPELEAKQDMLGCVLLLLLRGGTRCGGGRMPRIEEKGRDAGDEIGQSR
jgi:hypothetical protein